MAVTRPWVKRVCEVGFSAGQSANFYLLANPNIDYVGFDLMNYGYMWAGLEFLEKKYGKDRVRAVPGDITKTLEQTLKDSDLLKTCDVISVDPPHNELFTRISTENFIKYGANPENNVVIFDGCDRKPVYTHVMKRRAQKALCGGPGGAYHRTKVGSLTTLDARGQVGSIIANRDSPRGAICVSSFV